MSKIEPHCDLLGWQKGMELAAEAYRLAGLLPEAEEYWLPSQMLRVAASVPANITEGHARGTRKDYANFISVARGSLAETETFLLLAVHTKVLGEAPVAPALSLAIELGKMLNVLQQRLPPNSPSPILATPPFNDSRLARATR